MAHWGPWWWYPAPVAFIDQIRRAARSVAAAREAWSSAPRPVAAVPFSGGPRGSARTPAVVWTSDQMPPRAGPLTFVPGYSDHTYQQTGAPSGFEGFDLDRINAAVAAHRLGVFYESSSLMVSVLRSAPAFSALHQAIAPINALRRHVHGGDGGISKLVTGELAEQLCPRSGLVSSPQFPNTLWGTMAIYMRLMGWAVLQHVDGDPDPVIGVRPRYTRLWEPWAVTKTRSPNVWLAQTTEGPVQIRNDGKFTLVASSQEPHLFDAAIVALADPTLSSRLTEAARDRYLDFFGSPKLIGIMPPHVAAGGDGTGEAYFEASAERIYGPDGRGVLPNGADMKAITIGGEGSKAYSESYLDRVIALYMVLTGSAGTIGAGSATGAGPYQAAKGGPWNVRHDLVAEPVMAMVRAVNEGHCAPYAWGNYAASIQEAKAAGEWVDPVLEVPLVSPERDDRIASQITRQRALTDQVLAELSVGADVDDDRVRALADDFEARPFRLVRPSPALEASPGSPAGAPAGGEAPAASSPPPAP